MPKSELKEAVTYLRNEWNAVVDIFNYGDTYLDNNIVERMNRYISLSRKNSLFFGSSVYDIREILKQIHFIHPTSKCFRVEYGAPFGSLMAAEEQ